MRLERGSTSCRLRLRSLFRRSGSRRSSTRSSGITSNGRSRSYIESGAWPRRRRATPRCARWAASSSRRRRAATRAACGSSRSSSTTCVTAFAGSCAKPGLHGRRDPDARPRDRREHGDLQRRQRGVPPTASRTPIPIASRSCGRTPRTSGIRITRRRPATSSTGGRSTTAFSDMAAQGERDYNITGDGTPERVTALAVTANFFPMLGVAPQARPRFHRRRRPRGRSASRSSSATGSGSAATAATRRSSGARSCSTERGTRSSA